MRASRLIMLLRRVSPLQSPLAGQGQRRIVLAMCLAFLSAPALRPRGWGDIHTCDKNLAPVVLTRCERRIGRKPSRCLSEGHHLTVHDHSSVVGSVCHEYMVAGPGPFRATFLMSKWIFFDFVLLSKWGLKHMLYLGKWRRPQFAGAQSSKKRQVCAPAQFDSRFIMRAFRFVFRDSRVSVRGFRFTHWSSCLTDSSVSENHSQFGGGKSTNFRSRCQVISQISCVTIWK